MALIARAHDVNSNQVFRWRRQYLKGELEIARQPSLLPVKVVSEPLAIKPARGRKARSERRGIIDIDLGHARVRIEGAADVDCVRSAIESLCR